MFKLELGSQLRRTRKVEVVVEGPGDVSQSLGESKRTTDF